MRPSDTTFKVAMDDLNRFMKSYELPLDNQLRLREYFQRTKHLQVHPARLLHPARCTRYTSARSAPIHPVHPTLHSTLHPTLHPTLCTTPCRSLAPTIHSCAR